MEEEEYGTEVFFGPERARLRVALKRQLERTEVRKRPGKPWAVASLGRYVQSHKSVRGHASVVSMSGIFAVAGLCCICSFTSYGFHDLVTVQSSGG